MSDPAPSARRKPLEGLTVLDLARMLAGPYCSAILADLGAQVIKVEPPHGDDQRHIGAVAGDASLSFEVLNRTKRSIIVNLKHPEGVQVLHELALRADILVENYRPGVAERLGVGYDVLHAINPRLVYCSISGFGQHGRMAAAPSYDVVAQALSGLMSITGSPESGPTLVGESIADIAAGLYGAMGVGTALYWRELTGEGSHIDVALFDSVFSLLPTALATWQLTGAAPERQGNHHPLSAPFGAFQAGDAPFTIAVANNKLFAVLASALGRPELVDDPRFGSDALRRAHRDDLVAIIETWASTRTAQQAADELARAGVPASAVWDVDQAAHSTQVTERKLLTSVDHPTLGPLYLPEQPVHFDGVERGQVRPAPALGADTDGVLTDVLGMSNEQIARLRAAGTI